MGIGRQIFLFFASLKLAVIVILGLAGVLAAGTIVESMYGMRGAHLLVYGTPWFGGLLFLLGVNVTCAVITRWPLKPNQIGFGITHLGIITLLVGSFMTQKWGVDGNLPVAEQSASSGVYLGDLKLYVTDQDSGRRFVVAVPETPVSAKGDLLRVQLGNGGWLELAEFYPRAHFSRRTTASPHPGMGEPFVKLKLVSSRFTVEEELFARDPDKPTEMSLGPAILSLQKLWSAEQERAFLASGAPKELEKRPEEQATLLVTLDGREYRLSMETLRGWAPIGDTGHAARVDKFLPHAVVRDNQLVSKTEAALNPAVQLRIRSKDGQIEQHTAFAFFPEFPTLHRRTSSGEGIGATIRLLYEKGGRESLGIVGSRRGQLRLAQSADNKRLLYKAIGASGTVNGKGEVPIAKPVPTGWMDATFEIKEWLPAAVQGMYPRPVDRIASGSVSYLSALKIRSGTKDKPESGSEVWLTEGDRRPLSVGDRAIVVEMGKEQLALPFRVKLDKFTVGMDPGTSKAASYESEVTVEDPTAGRFPARISMNEPLTHAGYTLYQASYQQQEGQPTISIFSVNRDIGRPVKYAGSLIIVLGIVVMFYMNPHYFGVIAGRRKPQ